MKGISPLISLVITVLLITVVTTIVLTTLKPSLDRMRDSNLLTEAMQNLELIDSAIKQVSSESEGSKRTISLTVTDGEYKVNGTKEWVEFNYDLKSDFSIEGIIGNVRLEKSPAFLEYFNTYQENTNASPPWNILSGTWNIESGQYSGENGTVYYNHGETGFFSLEGKIINKSGTRGEIFGVPGSPENLVGYWTFDENSGTTAYDYSNQTNDGTLKNGTQTCSGGDCPTWVSGKSGYALSFDGSNDYIDCGDLGTGIKSIGFWIKVTSTTEDILELSSTVNVSVSGGTLSADGFVSPTIYVNGVVSSTLTTSWSYVTVTTGTGINASAVKLGVAGNSYLNGTIDEVRVWNRSLTANEVKSEYELSHKKLYETGKTDTIEATTNVSIVISNPAGHSHFDNVKIKTSQETMKLTVPYTQVDLNGTARFSKGNYKLTIEHKGVNSTVSKPMVELTLA